MVWEDWEDWERGVESFPRSGSAPTPRRSFFFCTKEIPFLPHGIPNENDSTHGGCLSLPVLHLVSVAVVIFHPYLVILFLFSDYSFFLFVISQ